MIHLKISNIDEINDWYTDEIVKIVKKNATISIIPHDHPFVIKLDNWLTDYDNVRQLISVPVDILRERYDVIEEYCRIIELFTEGMLYERRIRSIKSNRNNKAKYLEKRTEYIEDHISELLIIYEKLNTVKQEAKISDAKQSWKNFENMLKDAKKYIDYSKLFIENHISWAWLDKDSYLKGELVSRLNIKVCPYCNRQYIQSITKYGNKKYLGDIDHIQPKSDFPLFALSFYNLIPACKPCNQLFKRDKKLKILNPYLEGFDDAAILELRYASVKELIGEKPVSDLRWTLSGPQRALSEEQKNLIKNNIELFGLNEVYKSDVDEFQYVQKKKYLLESRSLHLSVKKIMAKLVHWYLGDKMYYGVSLDSDMFQNEILSKAIYDIVKYN
ncbi:HNH endonuclease signature motif containing protein [Butyrivibrio sp. XPD2002]|uniref:HNH endonuclease signature motif containing protein n=1 Tax=Butyrivibrio sp. XPD2002 TaxID=1280665 RepID=UPI0003F5A498|nr:HNH endonuclease [Butyrivibrio sp. XPD2002]